MSISIKQPDSHNKHTILLLLCSIILPAVLMIIGLMILGVTPFGDHSLAISDGGYYLNYLVFFKSILRGEEGLLYSFLNGLGGNQWSVLAWGWFNPVLFLFPSVNMASAPFVLTWICVLDLSLCGLTMYLLLAYRFGHHVRNLVFSTSYALIGFSVAYIYHYIFFVGVQLLPIVVLGLLMLLQGKSPLLYILSLAVAIFCNFYFGFMLCVASVLIFAAFLYVQHGELHEGSKRLIVTYAVSSLLAGLLPALMWLPALKAYSGGGRLEQTAASEFVFKEKAPFIRIFSKFFTGAYSIEEMVDGLPNIFCGILVVALTVLFFMDKEISLRRKRAAGTILLFYFLSFYIPAFTLLMHGGTHTNWFPYRYSFVFSFFMIVIASEAYQHLPEISFQQAKKCFIAIVIAVIAVFSIQFSFISAGSVLFDLLLLAGMGIAFLFYKKDVRWMTQRVLTFVLLFLVSVNLCANFTLSIKKIMLPGWEVDLSAYQTSAIYTSALVEGLKKTEDGFFRMEKGFSESGQPGLDPYMYGYHGVSNSTPAVREFIHRNMCRLGIGWYYMQHWYSDDIPAATDTLLGLKYVVSPRNDLE